AHGPRWRCPGAMLLEPPGGEQRGALVARLAPERAATRILLEGPERARRVARRAGGSAAASAIARACRGETLEVLLLAMALSPRAVTARRIRRYLAELRSV